ncbi:MAG: DUF4214 domain-containing protein [Oscillatoriales cyanobacterium]|nr:MAG: DUF4214 domain-containing protein [Oscillatoriales cyanobacterium]
MLKASSQRSLCTTLAALLATSAVALPAQAGNLCMGDLEQFVCLENADQHVEIAGAWNESLLAMGLDPGQAAEVDRLYQSILGRPADLDGLRTYTRALGQGWSLHKVRWAIANSSEAQVAIHRIYREVLDREADNEGLNTYRDRLERGWELNRVRNDINASYEAQSRRRPLTS